MEQNNYAVGEQRERDTKGWSDSEANKLRSSSGARSFGEGENWWFNEPNFPNAPASYSRAGLSQRTGSDGAPIQRMFEINIIAGCVFALESLWYAGERQLPNKISEKREISAHTRPLYMAFKLVPHGRNLGPTVQ